MHFIHIIYMQNMQCAVVVIAMKYSLMFVQAGMA